MAAVGLQSWNLCLLGLTLAGTGGRSLREVKDANVSEALGRNRRTAGLEFVNYFRSSAKCDRVSDNKTKEAAGHAIDARRSFPCSTTSEEAENPRFTCLDAHNLRYLHFHFKPEGKFGDGRVCSACNSKNNTFKNGHNYKAKFCIWDFKVTTGSV